MAMITTGSNKIIQDLFGGDAFIAGSIVDGGVLDIDFSGLEYYAKSMRVKHLVADDGSLTLLDASTYNVYGDNTGTIAAKTGALSAGETLLAVVVTAGGGIDSITMQEYANLASLLSMAVQDIRFTLMGSYEDQPINEGFDGPYVTFDPGKILSVALVQDTASTAAIPLGEVTVDIKIEGTTIWTVTAAPTLQEEEAGTVIVTLSPADTGRVYAAGDKVTCEYSAKTDHTETGGGEVAAADLAVIVRFQNLV